MAGGSIAATGGAVSSTTNSAASSAAIRRTRRHPPKRPDQSTECWYADSKPADHAHATQNITSSALIDCSKQSYGCAAGGRSAFLRDQTAGTAFHAACSRALARGMQFRRDGDLGVEVFLDQVGDGVERGLVVGLDGDLGAVPGAE